MAEFRITAVVRARNLGEAIMAFTFDSEGAPTEVIAIENAAPIDTHAPETARA